jgi:hypothetical protein
MTRTIITLGLVAAIGLALGCGGSSSKTTRAEDLLPANFSSAGLTRSSEVDVYVGEALWQYLGDETETYQSFGFIEAATADYSGADVELTIDVYRFDSNVNAEGLYDYVSPSEGRPLSIGARGVISPGNVLMVKGHFVVNIDAYDETELSFPALAKAAALMGSSIPAAAE